MPHAHCGPHAPCGGWPQHGARSPRCIRAARLGFTCHGRMSCVLLQGLPRARARVRVKRAISLAAPGSHLGPYPPAAPAAAARIPRCPPPPFPPTAPTAGSSGDKGSTFNQTLAHQTCERGRAWAAPSRVVPGPCQGPRSVRRQRRPLPLPRRRRAAARRRRGVPTRTPGPAHSAPATEAQAPLASGGVGRHSAPSVAGAGPLPPAEPVPLLAPQPIRTDARRPCQCGGSRRRSRPGLTAPARRRRLPRGGRSPF